MTIQVTIQEALKKISDLLNDLCIKGAEAAKLATALDFLAKTQMAIAQPPEQQEAENADDNDI